MLRYGFMKEFDTVMKIDSTWLTRKATEINYYHEHNIFMHLCL